MTVKDTQLIETMANEELKKVFQPLQPMYNELYSYVKENGTTYLEDVNLEIIIEDNVEFLRIEDQNLDYFLQKDTEHFRLFAQSKDQQKEEIYSVYHYPQLNHFYIIFESLMIEIGKSHLFEGDRGMVCYNLEKKVAHLFDEIFQKEESDLLSLYSHFNSENAFSTRLAIFKETVDDDDIFELLTGKLNLPTESSSEREERSKRDALVLKRDDDAFVLVIVENNDHEVVGKTVTLELCYTKTNDDNFPSLDFLLNNYTHYKCRPMYTYRYYVRKNLLEGSVTLTRNSNDIHSLSYFTQLKGFFEEWEKAKEQINH